MTAIRVDRSSGRWQRIRAACQHTAVYHPNVSPQDELDRHADLVWLTVETLLWLTVETTTGSARPSRGRGQARRSAA